MYIIGKGDKPASEQLPQLSSAEVDYKIQNLKLQTFEQFLDNDM